MRLYLSNEHTLVQAAVPRTEKSVRKQKLPFSAPLLLNLTKWFSGSPHSFPCHVSAFLWLL